MLHSECELHKRNTTHLKLSLDPLATLEVAGFGARIPDSRIKPCRALLRILGGHALHLKSANLKLIEALARIPQGRARFITAAATALGKMEDADQT